MTSAPIHSIRARTSSPAPPICARCSTGTAPSTKCSPPTTLVARASTSGSATDDRYRRKHVHTSLSSWIGLVRASRREAISLSLPTRWPHRCLFHHPRSNLASYRSRAGPTLLWSGLKRWKRICCRMTAAQQSEFSRRARSLSPVRPPPRSEANRQPTETTKNPITSGTVFVRRSWAE